VAVRGERIEDAPHEGLRAGRADADEIEHPEVGIAMDPLRLAQDRADRDGQRVSRVA
jgi:hypothetical protein